MTAGSDAGASSKPRGARAPRARKTGNGAAAPHVEHRPWSRERHDPNTSGIRNFWDDFLDGEEACFWGLTYDEMIIARNLASNQTLDENFQVQKKLNQEILPIAYVILSARGGDTDEFQFDQVNRKAPTLLSWNPEDINLLKRKMSGARISMLGEAIDKISIVSIPKVMEQYIFFQAVSANLSIYTSSRIPSLVEALRTSSRPLIDVAADLESMGTEMKALVDLAATLQHG